MWLIWSFSRWKRIWRLLFYFLTGITVLCLGWFKLFFSDPSPHLVVLKLTSSLITGMKSNSTAKGMSILVHCFLSPYSHTNLFHKDAALWNITIYCVQTQTNKNYKKPVDFHISVVGILKIVRKWLVHQGSWKTVTCFWRLIRNHTCSSSSAF